MKSTSLYNPPLAKIENIMRHAGSLVMQHFKAIGDVREKAGHQGLVTRADIESEAYLIDQLTQLLPQAGIIAEESGSAHAHYEYCWVIDPLDGTTNFVRGLPYFCISVALTYQGEPIFAAIYQPIMDEFFVASLGKGAFLNGKKIQVSSPLGLEKSLLVIGLPYTKDERYKKLLQELTMVAPQVFAIRHLGAAALDLAYVACGRLDGLFFTGLSWWDVAAGALLVTEAGGKATDFEGEKLTKDYAFCIAGGALVYDYLKKIVTINTP